jgi:hypothetical protein
MINVEITVDCGIVKYTRKDSTILPIWYNWFLYGFLHDCYYVKGISGTKPCSKIVIFKKNNKSVMRIGEVCDHGFKDLIKKDLIKITYLNKNGEYVKKEIKTYFPIFRAMWLKLKYYKSPEVIIHIKNTLFDYGKCNY